MSQMCLILLGFNLLFCKFSIYMYVYIQGRLKIKSHWVACNPCSTEQNVLINIILVDTI